MRKFSKIIDEVSQENISLKLDYLAEKEKIELDFMCAEKDRTVQEVLVIKSDRKTRAIFAKKILGFIKCYIVCVLVIFSIYQFILVPASSHEIPVSPINTLLGTTSAIVIGLLATVIHYLFPNNKK